MIRCHGCDAEFESLRRYKQHKATAEHPDVGETFVNPKAGDQISRTYSGP